VGNVAQGIERYPLQLRQRDNVVLFDDFEGGLDTTNKWNTVLSSGATATDSGGVVTLTNASHNTNDEVYLFGRQALFTPAPGKNSYYEFFIQYTEQNTNQVNLFCGIMNSVATGALVTADGGALTTGSAIGIFKKGGETFWRGHAHNANGSSSVQEDLSGSAAGLSTYTCLGIHVMAQQGSFAEISYTVDGALLRKQSDLSPGGVIKHILDLTSFSAAQLCVLLRAGTTATAAESVNVDYACGTIVRPNIPL
jgi:hypothetical protein